MYKGREWRGVFGEKRQKPEKDDNTHIAVAQIGKNPKPQTDPPKPPGCETARVPVIRGSRNGRLHYARCYKTNGWVVRQNSGKIRKSQSAKVNRKTNKDCSGEN